jgi:hypothetical protein
MKGPKIPTVLKGSKSTNVTTVSLAPAVPADLKGAAQKTLGGREKAEEHWRA